MLQLVLDEGIEKPVSINPYHIESIKPNYPSKRGTLIQMYSGRVYAVTERYHTLLDRLEKYLG